MPYVNLLKVVTPPFCFVTYKITVIIYYTKLFFWYCIVSERLQNCTVGSIKFVFSTRYVPGIFIIKSWLLRDDDFNSIKCQTETQPRFMIYQIVFHIYVLKPIKTFQRDLPLPISSTRVYLFTNLFQTNIIQS
jgi:hypothetical protein